MGTLYPITPCSDITDSDACWTGGLPLYYGYMSDYDHGSNFPFQYRVAVDTAGAYIGQWEESAGNYRCCLGSPSGVTIRIRTMNQRTDTGIWVYNSGIFIADYDHAGLGMKSRTFGMTPSQVDAGGYNWTLHAFSSWNDLKQAFLTIGHEDITYRLTNCTAPGAPSSGSHGATISVALIPAQGYGFVNSGDVYVTNDGVAVPSTLTGNTLTFTMP